MYKIPIMIIFLLVCISFLVDPDSNRPYTNTVAVGKVEEDTVVLITNAGYTILVDKEVMPDVKEGDIVNISYTIDVEATAELRDRIITLQLESKGD